jgi:hypothetical protein
MIENEANAFINSQQHEPYPFISEMSYSGDVRKIKINSMKGPFIGLMICIGTQIIFIFVGLFAFDNKPLRILFCTIQLPYIVIIALSPGNTICKYDYNSKIFTSYMIPTLPIPIPYPYFNVKINFQDISGFFVQKIKGGTKKYYKVCVKDKNDEEKIISLGQDTKCSTEYDERINFIPFILRAYLKPGEKNIL